MATSTTIQERIQAFDNANALIQVAVQIPNGPFPCAKMVQVLKLSLPSVYQNGWEGLESAKRIQGIFQMAYLFESACLAFAENRLQQGQKYFSQATQLESVLTQDSKIGAFAFEKMWKSVGEPFGEHKEKGSEAFFAQNADPRKCKIATEESLRMFEWAYPAAKKFIEGSSVPSHSSEKQEPQREEKPEAPSFWISIVKWGGFTLLGLATLGLIYFIVKAPSEQV